MSSLYTEPSKLVMQTANFNDIKYLEWEMWASINSMREVRIKTKHVHVYALCYKFRSDTPDLAKT